MCVCVCVYVCDYAIFSGHIFLSGDEGRKVSCRGALLYQLYYCSRE